MHLIAQVDQFTLVCVNGEMINRGSGLLMWAILGELLEISQINGIHSLTFLIKTQIYTAILRLELGN